MLQLVGAEPPEADGLTRLEEQVRLDLEYLGLPAADWGAPAKHHKGHPVHDVIIIGAGMNGLAVAASLLLKGISNIRVLESNREGQEGPWLTFARMDTLRSPKELPGLSLGIPSLSFRSWYEACYGPDAWEQLYKIPNADWVSYLTWFRKQMSIPVKHGVSVTEVDLEDDVVRVTGKIPGGPEIVFHARRVVLATGRGGAGGNHIPGFIDEGLWPHLAAHTNEEIDFRRLEGQSIAVIGGGASGWDNAATALEAGAERVDMYIRRPFLPQVNKGRGSTNPGYHLGWQALSDAERWNLMAYMDDVQGPVPHETVKRALAQPGFHIHLGTPVEQVAGEGGQVLVYLGGEKPAVRTHDFLIVGTGFRIDIAAVDALHKLQADIARWEDVYQPPPGLIRPHLAGFPYLGPGFELQERVPGKNPDISRIHMLNHGAALSHGSIASDIPGVGIAAERAATAIVAHLFREDSLHHLEALRHYNEPELIDTPFYVADINDLSSS